ncbi:hypothetical protein [Alteromonas sp. CYL-A6]|uniref:hypothetical protein n=1 Tax=Alteromonas nitratireducens TaxID=3390813 RepID=UPI0034B5C3BB
MPQASDNPSTQTDIFGHQSLSEGNGQPIAELCNALYERELASLATHGPSQISLLRRRLSGLPYYVKRAAYELAHHQSPLEVDTHNASWQAKQAAKCPGKQPDSDKTADWFSQYAAPGLVVPVLITRLDNEHIELDSVDRVERDSLRLHTNKYGWFTFNGAPEQTASANEPSRQLVKPSKATMTAACCGHSWNHKGRISPRALSLREMMLSFGINWKTFRLNPKKT